jgi:MFS family permease
MLVSRFFDGLAGSAFLSVAGGSIGDMFPRDRLQAPMMIYTASPFIGPGTNQLKMILQGADSCVGLGPILGGLINYNVSWRWSFYVLLIWSGIMLISIIFLIPET